MFRQVWGDVSAWKVKRTAIHSRSSNGLLIYGLLAYPPYATCEITVCVAELHNGQKQSTNLNLYSQHLFQWLLNAANLKFQAIFEGF